MPWQDGPNAGFSTADSGDLYLPVDDDPARPTVAAQDGDPGSILHLVRRLIALRRAVPALGSRAASWVLHDGYPLVHLRGATHLVGVNPRREVAEFRTDPTMDLEPLLSIEVTIEEGTVLANGFGSAIFAERARTETVAAATTGWLVALRVGAHQ